MHGLRELRVVDFSTEIAGPYCTRLLADAGAEVIKVEGPEGDPLRRWSATGADLKGEDSGLFRFLAGGKQSVVGEPEDAAVLDCIAGADLVVESFEPGRIDALDLPGRHPGLVLLSISPFGRGGPWTPAAVQRVHDPGRVRLDRDARPARSGALPVRGARHGVARRHLRRRRGPRRRAARAPTRRARRARRLLADRSDDDRRHQLHGSDPPPAGLSRARRGLPQSVETPSIEPTADGYVGFCTNSRQQFSDFLLLIERPDLRDDSGLAFVAGRMARFEEWNEIVHAYTTKHTTAEIVEAAARLRIPVAPVNDGDTVRHHEQLRARGALVEDPTGDLPAAPPALPDRRPRPAPTAARPPPRGAHRPNRATPARLGRRPKARRPFRWTACASST